MATAISRICCSALGKELVLRGLSPIPERSNRKLSNPILAKWRASLTYKRYGPVLDNKPELSNKTTGLAAEWVSAG